MATRADAMAGTAAPAYSISRVIMASAVGTMIEWYDFYIFGSLAAVLSPKFYPSGNDTIALIAYLSTFAVGFVVRPFGALFFGRIGDLVGRKYAFLVTLSIMGGATALIGLLPTYKTAGWFAPVALLAVRWRAGLGWTTSRLPAAPLAAGAPTMAATADRLGKPDAADTVGAPGAAEHG